MRQIAMRSLPVALGLLALVVIVWTMAGAVGADSGVLPTKTPPVDVTSEPYPPPDATPEPYPAPHQSAGKGGADYLPVVVGNP